MTPLTSIKNPTIKKVIALNKKRGRDLHGQFLVEGIREVEMALEAGLQPVEALLNPHWDNEALQQFITRLEGTNVYKLDNDVFDKISYRDSVANVVAVFPLFNTNLARLELASNALVLVLEAIEKPGNLGAIFRTADAAGIDAVIITNANTDFYNPNVIRASLGTVFTVPFAIASNDETLSYLSEKQFNIYSTYLNATEPHFNVDMKRSTALVMGSEANGITSHWVENADQCIKIPMRGKADSMNVSTSAAVVIYEAIRQRNAQCLH
ncbi:MAG: TrmH family RNA methyltransferase [Bacteroidia bacterium]|jgi:TrmH family RNA methyltransferase